MLSIPGNRVRDCDGITRPFLCLVSLLVFCFVIPVRASGQSGQWVISYSKNGSSVTVRNGITITSPWGDGPYPIAVISYSTGDSASATASGTVTATLQWLDPGTGLPAPNPPKDVYIRESATTQWSDVNKTNGTTTGSASNGIGSPYVADADGHGGKSSGFRIIKADGSSGTITLPSVTLNANTSISSAPASGRLTASAGYSVYLAANAEDFDFSGYPNPPPAGTTPYAQHAADAQKSLSDGTGYYATAYTNQTALFALDKLKNTALFFVFGHGGSSFQACQTFWSQSQPDPSSNWGAIVQRPEGRTGLVNLGMPAANIVVLDDASIASDAFHKVLLAIFEGCYTAAGSTWGNPVDGVFAKGANCALGFTTTIYSHDVDGNGNVTAEGAEEWAEYFWKNLQSGQTVSDAAFNASRRPNMPLGKNLRNYRIVGTSTLMIQPARYGQ